MDFLDKLTVIKDRLEWKGFNFLLCIPLNLSLEEYQNIKSNFDNQHPDNVFFDRKTLHLSFGRFRIKNLDELNEAVQHLKTIQNEVFSQEIAFCKNKFEKFNRYFSFIIKSNLKLFSNKIFTIFKNCKKYKHDGNPHITISSLSKENDFQFSTKMAFVKKRFSFQDLVIVALGPIENEEGEDEYIEINDLILMN